MQDEIFNMLMKEDDITWQGILTELVKSEKMDPWDIDVSVLTKKYIDMLRKLKELDLKVSGKVILCAAILLKMKSTKLMGADLQRLDELFAGSEEDEFDLDDDYDPYEYARRIVEGGDIRLIPRTPQPRKRKVSIYDLMEALQKAMEVKRRRVMRNAPEELEIRIPEKKLDISQVIREVMGRIKLWFFKNKQKLKFSQLVPGETKEDKIYTFIPLLHLTTQRKIDISQQEHFGEIEIELLKKKVDEKIEEELKPETPASE
ncbi:segregation/condensation protein A [Candidatus Woesearchaeota archaeon]|nr:segregation/condensation protein A [Candidatus Woesearchaeota archaeon]